VSGAPGADSLADLVNATRTATLGAMVAGVAHELNTPLGALHSNHDVLKRALNKLQVILADEVVEPSELEEVRRIVAALDGVLRVNDLAVERMVGLVASLRTFGRPDRSEIDRLDVRESIDGALTILAHELRDRVTVQKDYEDVPTVLCHTGQIGQVFMNLLHNASQAITGRGTITIRTRPVDDGVLVEIEDTGSGIPKENLDRIFEPGFTTKGARVGMGLGLLITQQVIERHRGRIAVRSEPGRGSTFSIQLPLTFDPGGAT
jgi:two-component system, NtrC family, sensor kinase